MHIVHDNVPVTISFKEIDLQVNTLFDCTPPFIMHRTFDINEMSLPT